MKRLAVAQLVLGAFLAVTPHGAGAAGGTTKYPWNIPGNIRIVQKDPVDGVRTFATIQAAINSITDASPTNPYVVRVAPGTYLEAVTTKDSVSLVGSGPESTIVESPTTAATISMSDATVTLSDLKVVQRLDQGCGIFAGGSLAGKTLTLRNVVVESLGTTGLGAIYGTSPSYEIYDSKIVSRKGTIGVRSDGWGSPSLLVERSVIESTSSADGDWALGLMGKNVTLRDSRVTITNPLGAYAVMVEGGVGEIVNSEITINADSDVQGAYGLTSYGNVTKIRSSQIAVTVANPTNQTAAIDGQNVTIDGSKVQATLIGMTNAGAVTVNNSTISGGTYAISKATPGQPAFKVGNSQLVGAYDGVAGADKIVNCHDGNYDPIPNL